MSDRRRQLLDATVAVIARRGVRGLRVQEVAGEVGVSVSLLYHYFGSREGLLAAALDTVSENAERYAAVVDGAPRAQLVARLLGEFQDDEGVRVNSAAWGELRWASVFDPTLRAPVARLTGEWVGEIADLVAAALEGRDAAEAHATAEVLVALVEGLSTKWLADATDSADVRRQLLLAIDRLVPASALRGEA